MISMDVAFLGVASADLNAAVTDKGFSADFDIPSFNLDALGVQAQLGAAITVVNSDQFTSSLRMVFNIDADLDKDFLVHAFEDLADVGPFSIHAAFDGQLSVWEPHNDKGHGRISRRKADFLGPTMALRIDNV